MQKLLKKSLKKDSVKIPFISKNFLKLDNRFKNKDNQIFDFIYVASEDKHKNHINLIKAWRLLAEENIYPSLLLTLNKKAFNNLNKNYASKDELKKLKINNCEPNTDINVKQIFMKSKALIFPSLIESYGLPLIEAKQLGMPILASELDYVRDIIEPDFTFDPNSAKSISRAVKRFFKISGNLDKPISSEKFIEILLNRKL